MCLEISELDPAKFISAPGLEQNLFQQNLFQLLDFKASGFKRDRSRIRSVK